MSKETGPEPKMCSRPCPDHTSCPPVHGRIFNPEAAVLIGGVPHHLTGSIQVVPLRDELNETLRGVFSAMRRDGQGLTLDQETTIRRGLGLI